MGQRRHSGVAGRLGVADLLGHPDRDPHGDPIPAVDGTLEPQPELS